MRKEYKVKSMPPWYYVFFLGTLVIALCVSYGVASYGWLCFLVPILVGLQGSHARIVIDKKYVFVQGMLAPQNKVRVENIRKIRVHRDHSLRIIHSRGVLTLDPANAEEVIDALQKEHPAIIVDR